MEIKSNLIFTLLSNEYKSTGGLHPANAASSPVSKGAEGSPDLFLFTVSLLFCSPRHYWCIVVVSSLHWWGSTFMEILSSAAF